MIDSHSNSHKSVQCTVKKTLIIHNQFKVKVEVNPHQWKNSQESTHARTHIHTQNAQVQVQVVHLKSNQSRLPTFDSKLKLKISKCAYICFLCTTTSTSTEELRIWILNFEYAVWSMHKIHPHRGKTIILMKNGSLIFQQHLESTSKQTNKQTNEYR